MDCRTVHLVRSAGVDAVVLVAVYKHSQVPESGCLLPLQRGTAVVPAPSCSSGLSTHVCMHACMICARVCVCLSPCDYDSRFGGCHVMYACTMVLNAHTRDCVFGCVFDCVCVIVCGAWGVG